MKSIFNGAPPGSRGGSNGSAGGKAPAPKLDMSGAKSDSLTLSWQWPSPPSGAAFELCWREASLSVWHRERLGDQPSFSAHRLSGLKPNTVYSIAVGVLETGGGEAMPGDQLSANTAPAAPTGLECCEASDSSLTLQWRPSSGGPAVRFAVYGSAALGFAKVYSGAESRCVVQGLTRGKEYGFRVCAMNAHGGASDFSPELLVCCDSSSVGVSSPAAAAEPAAGGSGIGGGIVPELLTLTHDSLSMRWPAPAAGASQYVVELAEGDEGVVPDYEEWTLIYEGAPPGCEISYLTPATEYHLRVASTDHSGRTSAFGSPLVVRTPDEPSPAKKKVAAKKVAVETDRGAGAGSGSSHAAGRAQQKATRQQPPPEKKRTAQRSNPRQSSPGRAATAPTPRQSAHQSPRQPQSPRQSPRQPQSPRQSPRRAASPRQSGTNRAPQRSSSSPGLSQTSARNAGSAAADSRPVQQQRTPRRPPPSPRSAHSGRGARHGVRDADETAGSDGEGGSVGASPRRKRRVGKGIHERLYAVHAKQVEQLQEAREDRIRSLSLSHLPLEQVYSRAVAPAPTPIS